MTPQELAIAQREFLIRTEKQSAMVLRAEFETLKKNINEYLTANIRGTITIKKLEENSFLEKVLAEIDVQLTRIRNPFTRIITRGQQRVVNYAANSLNKFLSTSIFSPDKEAIQKLIGRTQNGSTLARFFDRLNPVVADRAKAALIEGFELGESTNAIAKRLSDVSDIARQRALTIARTETNEAYRAASREFYTDAGIKEYVWLSKLDARTCLVCWMLHGRKFKTSVKTFSHPNCRCVLLPRTKSTANIPTGADLFFRLEKGFQKQILGTRRFETWVSGNIKLNDFVGSEMSEEFGERYFIKSLNNQDYAQL